MSNLPNTGLQYNQTGLSALANLRTVDALVQPAVIAISDGAGLTPANGDRYIVSESPGHTAFESHGKAIAVWNTVVNAWTFFAPQAGWQVYNTTTKLWMVYTDARWVNSEIVLNVRQFNVVGDGTTDDEPALNALFNAVASIGGPVTVWFQKGTYLIGSPIILDGETQSSPVRGLHIVGEPGTIIMAKTIVAGGQWSGHASALFQFRASTGPATDVLIEGLTFDGQSFGTTNYSTVGVYTTAITNLTIRECTFQNLGDPTLGPSSAPRNDGVLLGDSPSGSDSGRATNVRIEKCRFVNLVRNGISALDVDGLVVDGCYFDTILNSGLDIEPNVVAQYARNIVVTNSRFYNCAIMCVVCTPGAPLRGFTYADQMTGLKVTNCFMDGAVAGKTGVMAYDWLDVDISNNTIIQMTDPSVYLRSCIGARVTGNHVRDCIATAGAILINQVDAVVPTDHVIHGNTILNSVGYGVRVADLVGGSIMANVVRNYDTALAGRGGISLAVSAGACKNITLVGNAVFGGGGAGGVTGGGHPITVASGCTRILVVGNLAQECGDVTVNSDSAIDFDAASGTVGFNCDANLSTHPFTSPSGSTPLSGGALGLSSAARRSAYEVTVAAGAAAGSVSVASDVITSVPVTNLIFSPINSAAAAMMLVAGGVWCHRTGTGFQLTHQGNPDGVNAAIFMVLGVSTA